MGKKKRVHRLLAPEARPIPAEDLMGPPNKKKKIRKQIEKRAKRAAKEEAKALARAPRIQRASQPLNAPDHVVWNSGRPKRPKQQFTKFQKNMNPLF